LYFVALSPYPGATPQDKTDSRTQLASPADRFIGVWKLNVDKSSRTGLVSESITIESQESNVKFTYDRLGENGTELHWWFVTDMKGGTVKPTQVNGRPMSGESRITRLDSYRFKDESAMQQDEYEVSANGQTMIIKRTNFLKHRPPQIPKQMRLVYERQK
jgi:hypothetical protein